MSINDIFRKRKKNLNSLEKIRKESQENMHACPFCHESFPEKDFAAKLWQCPACGKYLAMSPLDRIQMIGDPDSFREHYEKVKTGNPLGFPEYEEKLQANMEKTGQNCAFVCGSLRIRGIKVAIGVLDGRFLMGSMGTGVGEKVALLAEYAGRKKLPLIIYSASGGARMQEGLFSLMQMAKTAAAIEKFKQNGGLFISFLTNPTTGGVSASYASLGDIILAEPDALICFAGPRVIEQTIGQKLPEGFQHAEFLQDHGMIDHIVPREKQQAFLYRLLRMHV